MSQEQIDGRPHDFHADRALLGHTAFLTNAIRASAPASRAPGTDPAKVGTMSALRRCIGSLLERRHRHHATEHVDAAAVGGTCNGRLRLRRWGSSQRCHVLQRGVMI